MAVSVAVLALQCDRIAVWCCCSVVVLKCDNVVLLQCDSQCGSVAVVAVLQSQCGSVGIAVWRC